MLSACADGATQSTSSPELMAPIPVHVSGGAGSGPAGPGLQAADTLAVGEAAPSMGMIAPWVVYDFVVGTGLSPLPVEANGWQYPPDAVPDMDRIAQIAAALGVEGDPVERSVEQGGGWTVGPDDGSGPALWVAADGQLSWWFNAPYAPVTATRVECATVTEVAPVDDGSDAVVPSVEPGDESGASGDPAEECVYEEPKPPTGVLTSEQARSRAVELLRKVGADPADFELEVYADEWFASVSAMQRLNESVSPIGWYFGFGAEGRLDHAGGVLAQPVEVGPYPLIDLETAVARLQDGYYGGIMPLVEDTIGIGAPELSCEEAADCESLPVEPEHVQVTITSVRQELWWTWDSDGSAWLLPAFTFLDADGGRYTVPAVTDEYLIVDYALVDPAIDEPAPLPPDVVYDDTAISEADAAALVGLSEDEALAVAAERGWEVRVVSRDGEQFPATDDYSTSRVNLTITGGTVTAATVG